MIVRVKTPVNIVTFSARLNTRKWNINWLKLNVSVQLACWSCRCNYVSVTLVVSCTIYNSKVNVIVLVAVVILLVILILIFIPTVSYWVWLEMTEHNFRYSVSVMFVCFAVNSCNWLLVLVLAFTKHATWWWPDSDAN